MANQALQVATPNGARELSKGEQSALLYGGVGSAIESVIAEGDLSKLSPGQRVQYYDSVCRSVGLNPLTRPFQYIRLSGKLTLYARRDAADQLRRINGVSIRVIERAIDAGANCDMLTVHVRARTSDGREDEDFGVVELPQRGEARANAVMKAITKAKRRVTLSICGLGWLDETEIEAIPGAEQVEVDWDSGGIVNTQTGEVTEPAPAQPRRLTQANPDPLAPQAIRPGQVDEIQAILASPLFTSDERNKALQKAMTLNERTAGGYTENLKEELARREFEAKQARMTKHMPEAARDSKADGDWENANWDEDAPFSDPAIVEDDLPR